ncbi:MAG: ester cyclase [Chlamydiales bacterium]|nr:ester cyclase [Chlamydiales bacterium]
MNNELKTIARTYAIRIWDDKDLTAVDDFFSSAGVVHSPLGGFCGPDDLKKVLSTWFTAFPDLNVTNIAEICEHDLVALQWVAEGTHLGEFQSLKPSGKVIRYTGVSMYRVNDSKIIEYWGYLDINHILTQISDN